MIAGDNTRNVSKINVNVINLNHYAKFTTALAEDFFVGIMGKNLLKRPPLVGDPWKMRILGLDYGSKRIGVAVCDELGMTAQGLAVIERKNKKRDMEAIGCHIRTNNVEKIVIGYPLRLNGTRGIQCEKVDLFIRSLEAAFSLPVIRWDETLTTKDAEEILRTASVRAKKRKAVVDKIAAGMILQGYLDSLL